MYLYPRKRAEERTRERREKKLWCQVPGCPNKHNHYKTSFRIPSDIERRNQWCDNLKISRRTVKINTYFVVCDDHFDSDQFCSSKRLRLKRNAVPRAAANKTKSETTQSISQQTKQPLQKITETVKIMRKDDQMLSVASDSDAVTVSNLFSTTFSTKVTPRIQPMPTLLRSLVQIPVPNVQPIHQQYVMTLGIPNLAVTSQAQLPLQNVSVAVTNTLTAQNLIDVSLCALCKISPNSERNKTQNVQLELEVETNQTELGQFLCKILDLNVNLLKEQDNLKFCTNCAARIENLMDINARLKMLEIRFENLKNELKFEMICAYLKRYWRGEQTEFYQEKLIGKWKSFAKAESDGKLRFTSMETNSKSKNNNRSGKTENAKRKLSYNHDVAEGLISSPTPDEADLEYSVGKECESEQTVEDIGVRENSVPNMDNIQEKVCGSIQRCENENSEIASNGITFLSASSTELTVKTYNKKKKRESRRRKCPVCFKIVVFLTGHMLIHTGTRPYKCNICDKGFRQRAHLELHKRRIHSPESTVHFSRRRKTYFQCSICWKEYLYLSNFLYHLRSYHLNNGVSDGDSFWFYDCDSPNCQTICSTFDGMKHHIELKHSSASEDNSICVSEIFECNVCSRIFCSQDSLNLHSQYHGINETTFGCNYCFMVFSSELELQKHASRHKVTFNLSDFKFQCELCGQGFLESQGLWNHQKSNRCVNGKSKMKNKKPENRDDAELGDNCKKKYVGYSKKPCQVCGKMFTDTNLKTHMFIHTHPEGFPCSECGLTLKNPKNVENHMYAVHKINCRGREFKHICEFCEHGVISSKDLLQHLALNHPLEYLGDKSYCMVCYRLFDNQSELDVHFHEKHSNFICPIEDCRRKFSQKSNLNRHLQSTHYNSRQYGCSFCQLRFNDSTVLRYHINVKHTFHRSFLCKLCPENPGFYERRSLKHHVDKNHPETQLSEIIVVNKLGLRNYVAENSSV